MKKRASIVFLTMMVWMALQGITAFAADMVISQTEATMNVGDTIDLDVTEIGNVAVWTSYNPNIAKVNTVGEVTALKKGKTTIRVRSGRNTRTCAITVVDSSVKLNKTSATIYHGGTSTSSVQLKATVKGTSKTVEWTSSNPSVATVNTTGKVTSVGVGTAVITASANGKSASCRVIVKESSIKLDTSSLQLTTKGTGNSVQLAPAVVGSSKTVKWTTSDKSIAAVSSGKVTGKKAGTATITAKANGLTATCDVTVEAGTGTISTASIDIMENSVLLKTKGTDKTYTLTTAIAGKNGTVTWKSSNTSVVSVSKGKLTANKAGTATITATANGVSDTVNVTVEDFDPSITLNNSVYSLFTNKGNTVTLKATVDGTNKTVSWSSSNPSAASVSSTGKVTAAGEGITTITATANGVSATCLITVRASDVVLSNTNISIPAGKKQTIYYDVIGASQSVTWKTTNSKVATVSKGVITAKKNGEADIKATANGITSVCHVVVTDATCNHAYDGGVVIKEPTCAMTGIKKYTCTMCGTSYNDTVAASGHTYRGITTEPTCIEKGYTTHTCSGCGASYIDSYTNAVGHSYGDWVTVTEPTEMAKGLKQRTCTKCSNTETAEIPVADHTHSYNAVVTAPTCTEQGYTEHTCTGCGESYKDSYVDALGHLYGEWTVVKEPTATEDGERVSVCSRCGNKETEVIPKADHVHEFTAIVIPAGCVTQGYTRHSCTKCDYSYDDEFVDALGHVESEWVITREPTCTRAGEQEKYCTRCNGFIDYEDIPKLGHELGEWTTEIEATCTENGSEVQRCTRCNEIVNSKSTEALGHSAGEWVVEQEATCRTPGYKVKYCTRCNNTVEVEDIEKTGHNYIVDKVVEPTNCGEGYTIYKCSNCGSIHKDDFLPVAGDGEHDFDFRNAVFDENDGCYHAACNVCGYYVGVETDYYQVILRAYGVVDETIADIIDDDMNDAEKVEAVYDWICNHCEYAPNKYQFSWIGVVLEGKAVCAGQAEAFKVFMDELGIKCYYVVSEAANHAWNKVKLDDGWYWVDCTQGQFLQTGVRYIDEVGGPVCDGTKWLDGELLYEKYFIADMQEMFDSYNLQKDNETLYFLFNSSDDFNNLWIVSPIYTWQRTFSNSKRLLAWVNNSEEIRNVFETAMADVEIADVSASSLEGAEESETDKMMDAGEDVINTEDNVDIESDDE